jgi:hypothetical protein
MNNVECLALSYESSTLPHVPQHTHRKKKKKKKRKKVYDPERGGERPSFFRYVCVFERCHRNRRFWW